MCPSKLHPISWILTVAWSLRPIRQPIQPNQASDTIFVIRKTDSLPTKKCLVRAHEFAIVDENVGRGARKKLWRSVGNSLCKRTSATRNRADRRPRDKFGLDRRACDSSVDDSNDPHRALTNFRILSIPIEVRTHLLVFAGVQKYIIYFPTCGSEHLEKGLPSWAQCG